MKHIRERRGMIHKGIVGMHHHHTGHGSVLFHDYAGTESTIVNEDGDEACRLTWHRHDVSHDLEFNHEDDDEKPCRDPNCEYQLQ